MSLAPTPDLIAQVEAVLKQHADVNADEVLIAAREVAPHVRVHRRGGEVRVAVEGRLAVLLTLSDPPAPALVSALAADITDALEDAGISHTYGGSWRQGR